MEKNEQLLIKNSIQFKKSEPLFKYTTTQVGGPAKYFVECKTEVKLISVIKIALKNNIPYLIIGMGSNLLISDNGFDGIAILNKVDEYKIFSNKISVKSGKLLLDLIKIEEKAGLSGMEKLAGIPGTVGGSVYGNAGAYGSSVSDCLTRVKIFDGKKIYWLDKNKCGFSYRESIFKKTKPIILEIEFSLKKLPAKEVDKIVLETLVDRSKKYNKGILCPGSFFKNVETKNLSSTVVQKIPKEKIVYGKIPAGYLLESVAAKGMRKGKIMVSEAHANFIINIGGGTAQDYFDLTQELKNKVKKKFGIELEPEVQLVGFPVNFKNKKVAVIGLGIEGKDLVNYLIGQKALITIFDKKTQNNLDLKGLELEKTKLVLGEKYLSQKLIGFDYIFRSPGVYRYLPEIIREEKKGTKISSPTQLFFDRCPGKIIGVTGTKGKGTTATLIYDVLKSSGKKVFLAGNIGKPLLELLPLLDTQSLVVLELSSFQLIDLILSPHIAVVLNVTSDHMDWHKNQKEYVEAKTSIVRFQKKNDYAVINSDYPVTRSFNRLTNANIYYFSRLNDVSGAYVENRKIYLNIGSRRLLIGEIGKLLLKGEHNLENITAAVCSSALAGADIESIKKQVFLFKGLEHRLELVRKIREVSFYNDSFATGPQPTIAAIHSFAQPITLILGGYDKRLEYDLLVSEITKNKNIISIILIGDLANKLNRLISLRGYKGKIINLGKTLMKEIVKNAFSITPKGGLVLLSPAAASFDMFKDYKERGNLFKEAVKSLK